MSNTLELSNKELKVLRLLVDISKHYVPIYCEWMKEQDKVEFYETVEAIKERINKNER